MNTKPVKGFRISPAVSDQFKRACKMQSRPASRVVEELIIDWLSNDGEQRTPSTRRTSKQADGVF